jgi:ABC-type transport system involved in multi-copper enzyme maturation permease subunit
MLWYKAWFETRWRFLIGLALLALSACGVVIAYPQTARLIANLETSDLSGFVGRQVREAAELSRTYRGYVWYQWFHQNLLQMWTVFAVLLGAGGLLSQSSGGGSLFTLSLPVTRDRLFAIRAATGLLQTAALAFVPSFVLALLSPAIGESYGISDVLVHSTCLFVAGSVFFSLAFLLSTVFTDLWRPLMLALGVAVALALGEQLLWAVAPYGVFHVMSAEAYVREGGVPWIGLLLSTAASLAMLFAATKNMARQDF